MITKLTSRELTQYQEGARRHGATDYVLGTCGAGTPGAPTSEVPCLICLHCGGVSITPQTIEQRHCLDCNRYYEKNERSEDDPRYRAAIKRGTA